MNIFPGLIVFSILIIVHEVGHFMLARMNGIRVERFSLGFGKRLFGFKSGGTDYCISAVPFGGYVKMAGDEPSDKLKGAGYEFLSKSVFARGSVIIAGPVFNYIFGFLVFIAVFMIGAPEYTSKVGKVIDGYPAELAGIKEGDTIVSVDGVDCVYWNDLVGEIQKKTEGEVSLGILRDGRSIKIRLKPKVVEEANILGKKDKSARIGVSPSSEVIIIKYGKVEAVKMAFLKTKELTVFIYKVLWALVTRSISLKDSVSGPVGIFAATGAIAKLGFIYILNMLGVFSVNLALLNILPIPVLDGGHILFLVLEKIRGRRLSVKAQEILIQGGMIALMAFMVFVSYNDISRMTFFKKFFGH